MSDFLLFFKVSNYTVLGLLFPLTPEINTSLTIPCSSLTIHTKYLNAARVTLDSSVHSGLMLSQTLVFLYIQDTFTTRLPHHISSESIVSTRPFSTPSSPIPTVQLGISRYLPVSYTQAVFLYRFFNLQSLCSNSYCLNINGSKAIRTRPCKRFIISQSEMTYPHSLCICDIIMHFSS